MRLGSDEGPYPVRIRCRERRVGGEIRLRTARQAEAFVSAASQILGFQEGTQYVEPETKLGRTRKSLWTGGKGGDCCFLSES
mmetsp:Transcript_23362/g.34178  ORF Transcript_23362/g.34178 Transcript_23362/m.34178 type:complete len:82 (-) Transcript_23362:197-442(-)